MAEQQCFNTVRLSPNEIETIMAGLERDQADFANSARRSRRWSIRGRKLILTTTDESGTVRNYFSFARNLSAGGIAILHGGYLHAGAKCFLTLRGVDGRARTMRASVTHCNHLQKNLHDVGLKFEAPINPRDFIDFGDAHVFTVEHVELGELKGSVLVVEDSLAYQSLIKHHFKGSPLDFTFVQDAAAAMGCLAEHPAMMFVDLHLPDKYGLDLIKDVRAAFYEGPIVVLTADTTPGLRAQALQAGANELLAKPCPPAELHRAAAEFLLRGAHDRTAASPQDAQVEPIESERMELFVELAKAQAAALIKAIGDMDLNHAKEAVRLLRASADGYGFKRLGELARDAAKTLDATMSVEESATNLNRLVAWCNRVADEHG